MRRPECGRESNMHWKFPFLSPCSLSQPYPLQIPEPSASRRWPAKLIPRVTWGRARLEDPEALSELVFSLLSSSQSRCWSVGASGKGNRAHMTGQKEKSGGARSRKSNTRCRVGAWKPILRNFTLPPKAEIGNVYELFFNRKKSRRWWAAEKTWACPKSASLVPNLALGWGPCRNLLEFSVSLLSLMCKPTLYLLPKQMRALRDTACGRALSTRAHQMWGVVDNEKSFRQKNSLEIWRR